MIYHITTQDAWKAAQDEGKYRAASLETQGFIHFSDREQIVRVANAVYAGQADLVLLCVDESKLHALMLREPPDPQVPAEHYSGELFPHVYGALNPEAVVAVIQFPPRSDGGFELPDSLP